MTIDWWLLLQGVLVSAAGSAPVVFLSKALITQRLSRDLERLKAELSAENKERELRFAALHPRRVEAVASLNAELQAGLAWIENLALMVELRQLSPDRQSTGDDDSKIADRAVDATIEAVGILNKVRLFLDPTTVVRIETALSGIREPAMTFAYSARRPESREQAVKRLLEQWGNEGRGVRALVKTLEAEFRDMLGVDAQRAIADHLPRTAVLPPAPDTV